MRTAAGDIGGSREGGGGGGERLTFVIWKDFRKRFFLDLFQEQVLLVEEEDHGGLHEPLVVQDGVEQPKSFVHPILNGRRK